MSGSECSAHRTVMACRTEAIRPASAARSDQPRNPSDKTRQPGLCESGTQLEEAAQTPTRCEMLRREGVSSPQILQSAADRLSKRLSRQQTQEFLAASPETSRSHEPSTQGRQRSSTQ